MLSSRNPVESGSEAINAVQPDGFLKDALISALLTSGYRQKDDEKDGDKFSPCPLGTFIDPSTKGERGCQKCPPGNLLLFYSKMYNVSNQRNITISIFFVFDFL